MLLAPQAYYTLSKRDFIHTFILVTFLFNCSLVMIKFHSAFLVHADLGEKKKCKFTVIIFLAIFLMVSKISALSELIVFCCIRQGKAQSGE